MHSSTVIAILQQGKLNIEHVLFPQQIKTENASVWQHKKSTETFCTLVLYYHTDKMQWQIKMVKLRQTNEVNSLETVSLSRHVLQVLFQGLAELSQVLLGNVHLLADQVEGLKRVIGWGERERGRLVSNSLSTLWKL